MSNDQKSTVLEPHFLCPPWSGRYGVEVYSTTRVGGVSTAPYDSFNLGLHVDDNNQHVQTNRQRLRSSLNLKQEPFWLKQVHGTRVVQAVSDSSSVLLKSAVASHERSVVIEADGAWTRERLLPLAVLTADCLPVVLATGAHNTFSVQQKSVAAVHAGWRGMAAGILQTAVESLDARPSTIAAWLGPAIGPQAFEVGQDVYDAFATALPGCETDCFKPVNRSAGLNLSAMNQPGGFDHAANDSSPNYPSGNAGNASSVVSVKDRPDRKSTVPSEQKWLCDLYAVARRILTSYGITEISGGNSCTFCDNDLFYSHRRDGPLTGRMATIAVIRDN